MVPSHRLIPTNDESFIAKEHHQQSEYDQKLDSILASLARMELRSLSEDVREMLEDQGAAYVRQKDKNLVATWGQKTLKTAFS